MGKDTVKLETEEEWNILIDWLESKGDDWSKQDSRRSFVPGINISYDLNNVKVSSWKTRRDDNAITFDEWNYKYNGVTKKEKLDKGMEKQMLDVLNKTYDNSFLRQRTIPLFMSNPGVGKSTIIKEFADSKGVHMAKITLSQRMPNEVTGGVMPSLEKGVWETLDNQQLADLKDGDILFFDEVFNGTLKQTLDAVLNLLEDRMLPSGKKLADVMIVAASNFQGLIQITPQVKERFIRYDLKFDSEEWINLMIKKYGMPREISAKLCKLIHLEKFENADWTYYSPRSIEKSILQAAFELEGPLDDKVHACLIETIKMPSDSEKLKVKKGDEIEYLTFLKEIVKAKQNIHDTTNKEQKNRTATSVSC